MRGPEDVAASIAGRLEDALPARLTDLEVRLELDAGALPAPAHVYASEVDRLAVAKDFPAILVVAQEAQGVEVTVDDDLDAEDLDEAAAGPTYVVRYPVRVFVWAAVPDAGAGTPRDRQLAVDLMRKRYTLAVREALLADLAAADGITVEHGFRESYSDIDVDSRAKLTLAASYVAVTAAVEETLSKLPAVLHRPAGPRTVIVETEPLE